MRAWAKNAILLVVSLAITLVVADFIVARVPLLPTHRAALKAGVAFDARDRLDVVLEKRASDANWYPAVPANTYLENHLELDGRRVLPLAGVANAKIVSCNESGYFSTFTTDEFGFNNPSGAWTQGSPASRIYFVGDSFTQGDCLNRGQTYVDRVRAQHPGVVNLGGGGNGPLLELAAIREYVTAGEVDTVFWMYYEGNDLADLERDKRDGLLPKYLDPAFSQGLKARREKINERVRGYVDARMREHAENRPRLLAHLRHLLWTLRQRQAARSAAAASHTEFDLALFERVLATARDEVAAKGGQLVLVYLPEFARYGAASASPAASQRASVLAIASKLGLQLIDMEPVVAGLADPRAVFPFGIGGTHYDEDGTRLVAEHIINHLTSRAVQNQAPKRG